MRKLLAVLATLALSLPAAAQVPPIWAPSTGSGSPPSRPAGGDLTGSYPNPGVAAVGGFPLVLGGAVTHAGSFATTITATAVSNATLPAGTHSLAPLDNPTLVNPNIGAATGSSLFLTGQLQSQGSNGALVVLDRSTSGNLQVYRNAGLNHLYDSVSATDELSWAGGVWLGAPTGAAKGVGSLNLAAGLWDNGTAPTGTAGSGYVRATAPSLASPTIAGGALSGLTGLAIRDTSAAFDVTLGATSSTALTAGRTITLDTKNVAHTLALNATANTITFPNTASYTLIGSGDTGTVTNTMLAGSIAASKLVGTDIATLGTVTAGTWNGALVGGTWGGTGVNNGANTITLAGNLTEAGAFARTITATATSNATLPAGTHSLAPLDSPVFTTPNIGAATATSINGNTITAGSGTLTLAAGKTLTANNNLILSGVDGTTLASAWAQPAHQNIGGTCNGHVLCFGDQNMDLVGDHLGIQSIDASQINSVTLGGTITAGDQIGWQFGAASSYVTVVSGDTTTTILNKLAAALNGGAQTATITAGGTGYTTGDVVKLTGAAITANCGTQPLTPPAFTVTASSGIVSAAVIAGTGGSGIMGGYCTANPGNGTYATTGGTGTGLTLNVTFSNPAISAAMLAIHDANGYGYAATGVMQNSTTMLFDFPYGSTILTCASGGTGVSCPGTPTETIAVSVNSLDNGPYMYATRYVSGRLPVQNDAIGWFRTDGASTATSGIDTQYGGVKIRVGIQSPSAPEGAVSIEGSTGGNKASLPLFTCVGSLGCWVEDGIASNPAQGLSTSRGGFGVSGVIFGRNSITTSGSNAGFIVKDRTGGASTGQFYRNSGSNQFYDSVLGGTSFSYANGVWIGGATGTDKGAGSLNLAAGLYDNGTAPSGTAGTGYVRATAATLTGATLTDTINQEFEVSTATLTATSNTTLATVTGLSQALTAGKTYNCHGHLTGVSGASGGIKAALIASGSLSATSMTFTGFTWAGTTAVANTTVTALAANIAANTAIYSDIYIDGSIVVNVAGTINVQAAQNVSNATSTTVLQGSTFSCVRVN